MEIKKIWHVLSFGIQDLSDDLKQFQRDTMDAATKRSKVYLRILYQILLIYRPRLSKKMHGKIARLILRVDCWT